jgi:hypothetical protein
VEEAADEAALAEAATKPISTEKPLPASIKPTGPLSEVIRLANSGVDESVMMAYITNSTRPFNLGVEEIIYLNDIGVPGSVVTAMIQRDQELKGLLGGAAPAQTAPAPSTPANQAAPDPSNPALYAPQPAATPAPPEIATEGPPPGDNAAVDYSSPLVVDSGYSTFYDSLAPYGTWVDVGGYGPCWQPTVVVVNPTWRPYCDGGRWIYSDCGWYWLSGYSWGWAPFHYGRWFQHHRMGWCWAPDRVWGPSWVCWRYGDSHCGWAPLPPGAWYRPGVGLTYHGRHVGTSFGFGLGVNSFAFVDVGHFRNPHLNRHALPPQQAAQVYNRTVGSTTLADHKRGVINHGIPVSRVAAATGTKIHPVAIRDANSTARPGARSEQFEGNGRTLSVVRPHFPAPSGTQQASGGRSKTERNEGSIPAAASTTPGATHDPLLRAGGGTAAAQPNGTGHLDRPATGARETATTATGSRRTISTVRSDPTPKSAAPLILHGPDRSATTTGNSGAGSVNQASPPKSTVYTIQRNNSPQQPMSSTRTATQPLAAPRVSEQPARSERQRLSTVQSYQAPTETRRSTAAPTTDSSRSRTTTSPQEAFSRPTVSQRPQSVTGPAWSSRAPSESVRSTPRAIAPSVRSEPTRQYTAPSYQAPAVVQRVAPAPAPAPQQTRSYSSPTVSSTPRAPAMESRPSYSAPSAPASSAPASRGQSSSDRRGR